MHVLSQKHSQSFIKLVHYVHKNNVFTLECNTVRGRHIDTSIRPPIELTIYNTLLFVVRVGPRARRPMYSIRQSVTCHTFEW